MVIIHDKQELLLSSDAVVFRQQLSTVLTSMREELDDHRLAVNENTSEQSATYEFLSELSRRVDKLAERLDELCLLVKGQKAEPSFDVQPLSAKEKEVFNVLYNVTEEQPFASYDQLARKCLLSREQVVAFVTSMIHKGIPVLKKQDGSMVFVKLDPVFRELQAKKNLVGLDAPLSCWLR
ncbi:hypothetical protein HY489_00560 [Candidatus Woesearchaeota archaeon]|nr:hypothetical protein [Candidatus Woesearchaeota archaeon]